MRFLVGIMQFTWGFPQSLLGFLLFVLNIHRKHYFYRNCLMTEWNNKNSCSLGFFVFIAADHRFKKQVMKHEYGHCIQSLLLGPAYLLLIGLPSFLWCNLPLFERKRRKENISYYAFYPESWADDLADKYASDKKTEIVS